MFQVEKVEATGIENSIQECGLILVTRKSQWRTFPFSKNKATSVHTHRHRKRNHGKGDNGDSEACFLEGIIEEKDGSKSRWSPGCRREVMWRHRLPLRRQVGCPTPSCSSPLCSPHCSQTDPSNVKVKVWSCLYPVRATSVALRCSQEVDWTLGPCRRWLSPLYSPCSLSTLQPQRTIKCDMLPSFPLKSQNYVSLC